MQTRRTNKSTKEQNFNSKLSKEVCSFKIGSSAFSKVVPRMTQNKLFKELPSLLNLSNNLSQNINNDTKDFETEREDIFNKIYSEVHCSFTLAKASLKGKLGFNHPINIKQKRSNRGVRNIKRHQDSLLLEEISSRIKEESTKDFSAKTQAKIFGAKEGNLGENTLPINNKIKDCSNNTNEVKTPRCEITNSDRFTEKEGSKTDEIASPEAAVACIFETIKSDRTSFVDNHLNKVKIKSFYQKELASNTNSSSESQIADKSSCQALKRTPGSKTMYNDLVDELISL
ncbi:unnamed protein product [Moneuplotes crassus]|uniref:Uncharacterized protein n=1 Tax=Euplotes crassus TaxID=5936 RepID=A0AAD1UDK3_EUPCR|nr:unnamed protein product [Moneuplotes crassus]